MNNSPGKTSFTFKLTEAQQEALEGILATGNYKPATVPHTRIAVEAPGCRVNLYTSGKCLVQGKNAEEFVLFTLEPRVLGAAAIGYDAILNPAGTAPHMGIDESGKGDVFGPLVVAGAYVDPDIAADLDSLKVRDSKKVGDAQIRVLGPAIRRRLGPARFTLIQINPAKYNQLYARIRNVNQLLAWAHARAIENILTTQPDCPRAVSDQFGAKHVVERALMKKGQRIELVQQHRAESDIAVAAASILAREAFLSSLARLREHYAGGEFPKGASAQVRQAAVGLVRQFGPQTLLQTAKCHFRTIDEILAETGHTRTDLGPDGEVRSRLVEPRQFRQPKEPQPCPPNLG